MAIAEREKFITETEFMALDEDDRVEIIDGETVEMSPNGILHLFLGKNVYDSLNPFVVLNKLGYVFSDGLICILDKSQRGIKGAQVPDVCFIRKGRIPKDFDISRPFPGAPDLAVEIVSPGDDVNKLIKRVRKYLEFGTEQVWVIYPEIREVHQHRHGSDMIQVYKGSEQMDVEVLFPGLVLTLEHIFKLPELG